MGVVTLTTTASTGTHTASSIARSSVPAQASRRSRSACSFLVLPRWLSCWCLLTNSVALLADLIHNFGDALTAVPLGIAFFLRSVRGEKLAGLAVVLAIFISACVALYETILRFIHPHALTHLWVLAAAGVIGFIGNELAAQIRLRAGRRLGSAAMTADGNHARVDGFVSLGVVGSAIVVGLGAQIADPIIGLVITLVILKITWDSWRTVRAATIDLDYVES